MAIEWNLVQGGEARLVEMIGERAVVEAAQPFPTGATLIAVDPRTQVEYRVKVRGSRRVRESWYVVEGRFVSLTKPQREELAERLGALSSPREALDDTAEKNPVQG
jgi:hypothetical protein